MSADLRWPLGRSGDRALVVLDSDAELIAPVLDGEPEPEDRGAGRWVPLGIPSLAVDLEQLRKELASGPPEAWLVLPRSDGAEDFYEALAETMVGADMVPPAGVFLPEPLTLADLIGRLPSGPTAGEMGRPSRNALFTKALITAWVANAPDAWLAPYILAELDGTTASGIV